MPYRGTPHPKFLKSLAQRVALEFGELPFFVTRFFKCLLSKMESSLIKSRGVYSNSILLRSRVEIWSRGVLLHGVEHIWSTPLLEYRPGTE